MKRSVFLLSDHYPQQQETLDELHSFVFEHANLADTLGFEALWLAEHHFQNIGTVPNPAVMLAAIAMQTKRLRLGPAVAVLPYRNPVFIAEDYALVDLYSKGRLNMGVGCGSQKIEFSGLDADFDNRWQTFQQNLVKLRELWAETTLNINPPQQPPPVYVASNNPKNARSIGQNGDSVITLLAPGAQSLDHLAQLLDAHQQGLHEGGYFDSDAEVVVAQLAHVAASDQQAREQAIPALARFLTTLSADGSQAEAIYTSMQKAATACFGSTDQVAENIDKIRRQGVQHLAFITRFGNLDTAAASNSLQLLAPSTNQ